jgi:hypothetical protein
MTSPYKKSLDWFDIKALREAHRTALRNGHDALHPTRTSYEPSKGFDSFSYHDYQGVENLIEDWLMGNRKRDVRHPSWNMCRSTRFSALAVLLTSS